VDDRPSMNWFSFAFLCHNDTDQTRWSTKVAHLEIDDTMLGKNAK